MRLWTLLLLSLFFPGPSFALEQEEGQDAPTRTLSDYIKDYVDVPEDGIDWKMFGQTEAISIETKDAEGLDVQYYRPKFSPDVIALDGKEIILKGYMFPLDATEEQSLFLFGPFPINCPFQYHVGPSLVMEIEADKPVKFDYEALTLKGTLELVKEDPENGVFYRLVKARKI